MKTIKVTHMEQNPQAHTTEPGDKPITEKSMAKLLEELNLASTNPVNITQCYDACCKLANSLATLSNSDLKVMLEQIDEEHKSGSPVLHCKIDPNLESKASLNRIADLIAGIRADVGNITDHLREISTSLSRISCAAAIVGIAFALNIILTIVSFMMKWS